MRDYENCKHYEAEETDYDVTNGHSSYESYCNAGGKRVEIYPFSHCNRCGDMFEPLRDLEEKGKIVNTVVNENERCSAKKFDGAGEIKRTDVDNPVKKIIIEYEDGTTRVVEKGFIADVKAICEAGEDDEVDIHFNFANIGGNDIAEVIYSVTELGVRMGLFDK